MPARERGRREHGFVAADDRDVDPAAADGPHRLADRHRRRSACARIGERRAARAEDQRDLGGRGVGHRGQHGGRPHTPSFGVQALRGVVEGGRAGHAAAPVDAQSFVVEFDTRLRESRLRPGVARRRDGHRRAAVQRQPRAAARVGVIEIAGGDRECHGLERADLQGVRSHRRAAGEQRLVECRERMAQRRDEAHAGDRDARGVQRVGG
jgi:hypothetical protein